MARGALLPGRLRTWRRIPADGRRRRAWPGPAGRDVPADGYTPNRELTDAIMNIGLSGSLTAGGEAMGLILDVGGYYKNVFTMAPSFTSPSRKSTRPSACSRRRFSAASPKRSEQGDGRMAQTGKRRVAVTGLGVVAGNGVGIDEFWRSNVEGRSGVTRIDAFDAADFPSQIASQVRGFEPEKFIPMETVQRTDPFVHFGLACAEKWRWAQAGWIWTPRTGTESGCHRLGTRRRTLP